jgi:hypothetical protein
MPKRKPPPVKRTWARIVNREWQLNLVGGEILTPVRELSVAEGRQLIKKLRVFYFGYGMPVRELSGDGAAIESELKLVSGDVRIPERNELELYRSPGGTEAVVVYHQH